MDNGPCRVDVARPHLNLHSFVRQHDYPLNRVYIVGSGSDGLHLVRVGVGICSDPLNLSRTRVGIPLDLLGNSKHDSIKWLDKINAMITFMQCPWLDQCTTP